MTRGRSPQSSIGRTSTLAITSTISARFRHFGEAFTAAAIAAHRAAGGDFGDAAEYRAQRYWQARDLGGLAFQIEHEDEAETLDQIRKVREVHFGTSPI